MTGSVTGIPSSDQERYVRRSELAEIMGVSVDTVDRLVRAGMPSVVWGARARRFLPSRALAWAHAHDGRANTATVAAPSTIRAHSQIGATQGGKPLGRRSRGNEASK